MTLALGSAGADEVADFPGDFEPGIGRRGTTVALGDEAAAGGGAEVIRVGLRPDDPIVKERPSSRRPSVVIGILPEELAALTAPPEPDPDPEPELPPAPVFSDRGARDELRKSNPTGYAALVASGALDPEDPGKVALALQTELKGMGCYTSVLDNDWGRGSRASLERYAEQRGVTAASIAPNLDATIELWRDIISNDAVKCPATVAAAPAKKSSGSTARKEFGQDGHEEGRTQEDPSRKRR